MGTAPLSRSSPRLDGNEKQMKANDSIPRDEMLLAEALAAARARGLGHVTGQRFWPFSCAPKACCAEGALELAGVIPTVGRAPEHLSSVWVGNDDDNVWEYGSDNGESLGWAFRCAMESDNG
jgi:hypothetical protein